jgi:RpiR family transcriptional regulator, carbohydrate utilization regulator
VNATLSTGLRERIRQLVESEDTAVPRARRDALAAVMADPQRALDEGFMRLAERSGCSLPTLMRSARDLGFSGLREFRLALARDLVHEGVREGANAVASRAPALPPLHRRVRRTDPPAQVVAKVVGSAAATLEGLRAQLDPSLMARAAQAIAQAGQVSCWSVGATSSFMATDLQARLHRLGVSASAWPDPHHQLSAAAMLGAGDVALAVSHVGGMPSLLEAVDVAKAQGACVIALTQAHSPLARLADMAIALQVPDDPVMHVGTEAYLAHLTVIEVLTVLVAQQIGPQAEQRLARVRAVLSTHGLDTQPHPFVPWGEPN